MKIFKNQKGFTAFEAVLIMIILGLIGYVGYQAYSSNKKADSTTSATPAAAKKAVDPYAGWLTFKASNDTLTFKYPSDWKVVDEKQDSEGFQGEGIIITSPSGLVIHYTANPDGLGGGCPGCQTTINKFEPVTAITSDTVYLAELVTKGDDTAGSGVKEIGLLSAKGVDSPGVKLTQGATGDWIGWPIYVNPSGQKVWIRTNSSQDTKTYAQTPDQFFQQPEVQTAEKILKSFSYK
jgi:Tfp pilus assembly protein PilE